MKKISFICLLMSAMSFASAQQAHLQVTSSAEKEEVVMNADGEKETKVVPVATVTPGDVVIYTIAVENTSDEAAYNVMVTDPIPEQMAYVAGSAYGSGMDITYSVDDGKTFATPDVLEVKDAQGEWRAANAEDYTHVRWKLRESLPAQSKTEARFRARLK